MRWLSPTENSFIYSVCINILLFVVIQNGIDFICEGSFWLTQNHTNKLLYRAFYWNICTNHCVNVRKNHETTETHRIESSRRYVSNTFSFSHTNFNSNSHPMNTLSAARACLPIKINTSTTHNWWGTTTQSNWWLEFRCLRQFAIFTLSLSLSFYPSNVNRIYLLLDLCISTPHFYCSPEKNLLDSISIQHD